MRKLKVACVGVGYFSRFHYDAWQRIDQVALVGSCDQNLERAKEIGVPAFDDFETMLDNTKPDIVDIITPPSTHLAFIKLALTKNIKAIICQKPFCNSLEEARKALELGQHYGVPIIVHENFRFQPWYRVMKREIENGTLGDIHQLTFRLRTGDGQGKNAYLDRQPYFQTMQKFLIHETGVHWIDTFCFLLGEPTSVYADLRKMNPVIAGEDAGFFILEFENGIQALFDANRHLDHSADNCRTTLGECLLEGTKATLSLNGHGEVMLRDFGSTQTKVLLPANSYKGFGGDCVHALQTHVIDALRGKGTFENSVEDYLKVLKLEDSIYKSDLKGEKIKL